MYECSHARSRSLARSHSLLLWLRQNFVIPLSPNYPQSMAFGDMPPVQLSAQEHALVFSTIEEIFAVHSNTQKRLLDLMKHWPVVTGVGELYLNYAPMMEVYGAYVRNFDNSQSTLQRLKKDNPNLARFLERVRPRPRPQSCPPALALHSLTHAASGVRWMQTVLRRCTRSCRCRSITSRSCVRCTRSWHSRACPVRKNNRPSSMPPSTSNPPSWHVAPWLLTLGRGVLAGMHTAYCSRPARSFARS